MKKVYLGGDLLKKGSQILRELEAKEIINLGYEIHSPKDDSEINDKAAQTEESNNGLAEKIVRKDTNGILESQIIVIEPHENACGTMVELGQLKGMKDAYEIFAKWLAENNKIEHDIFTQFVKEIRPILVKKVYPHVEDIRRTNIPECGDRRSWGINQYVFGTCLDLTNGKGLYEWKEILVNFYIKVRLYIDSKSLQEL